MDKRRHQRHDSFRSHHRHETIIRQTSLDPAAGKDALVRSWLEQIDSPGAEAGHQLDHTRNGHDNDFFPLTHLDWRPHNLPTAPAITNNDSSKRRRYRFPDNDTPIAISTESFQHHDLPQSGIQQEPGSRPRKRSYDKYNVPSSSGSHGSLSDDWVFEKRARRKTRPDRYDTKKREDYDNSRRSGTQDKPRRSLSNKHELRSSRDIVTNFTSAAIKNHRVTVSIYDLCMFVVS